MAYIRDFTVFEATTATTNPAADVDFPEHKTNDYILLSMVVDGNQSSAPTLPGGYTNIQDNFIAATGGHSYRVCYKKVTGADNSEVCPTLSTPATDEWHISVIAIAGADGASPISFSGERTTVDSAAPFTWTSSLSSGTDANVLIFHYLFSDSGIAPTARPPHTNLVNGDAGTVSGGVAYIFQPTAGAITDSAWIGHTNDDTTQVAVGFKDDGGGTRPAYADPTTVGQYISQLGGTTLIEGDTNPAALTYGMIGQRAFTQFWAFDGTSTYTNDTTDITDVGTADVTITNANGAIWYFGYDYTFGSMMLDIGTASSGGTIVWEYYNGAWTSFTMSGVLTATGFIRFSWTVPTDWTSTSVNSVTKFYVRMRVTATFTTAPILDQGFAGGRPTTFDAVGNTADAGVNPYNNVIALTAAAASGGQLVGSERQFGAARDMDTGIVIIQHQPTVSRDYAVDPAIPNQTYPVTTIPTNPWAGFVVVFGDTDGDYEAYAIAGKFAENVTSLGYNVAAIAINNGAEAWGINQTLDKGAITRMLFLPQSRFGQLDSRISGLSIVDKLVYSGGDSTNPINLTNFIRVGQKAIGDTLLVYGVGTYQRIYCPIQIGGGDPINIQIDGVVFGMPTTYDGKDNFDWNADDNYAGFQFYGKSGDTIKFTNCTWTGVSPIQPYRWEFNASHSGSATIDFSGTKVQGGTVTLRSTVTLNSVIFVSCNEIVLNGADLTSCTLRNQRIGDDFGAVAFTSATEGNGVTNCTFTNNNDGDLGHSIRITATGTYTFNNHQFSGGGVTERNFNTFTGVNESTDVITTDTSHGYTNGDAVYYQDQGGTTLGGLTDGNLYYVRAVSSTTLAFYTTKAAAIADSGRIALTAAGSPGQTHYIYSAKADVFIDVAGATTINITNGGDIPTIRRRDGSTVTINNSVNLTVTVLDKADNSPIKLAQVAIYRTSDDVSLMNEDTETVTAGSFVVGVKYRIVTVGTTDFTLIGAASNTVGVVFTATGVGSGTGTATNGIAVETFNYVSDTPIYVRVRKSLTGETKYVPLSTTGTITSTGFSVTVSLSEDTNA